jgi:ribosomal protein S27AE
MNDTQPGDSPRPTEYIIEFGEVVYMRPGGCPRCGYEAVTVESVSCRRCGSTFAAWTADHAT